MAGDSAVSPRAINGSRDGANYKLIRGTWPVPLRVKVRQTSGLSFLCATVPSLPRDFLPLSRERDRPEDGPTNGEGNYGLRSFPLWREKEGSAILMTLVQPSVVKTVRREKLCGIFMRSFAYRSFSSRRMHTTFPHINMPPLSSRRRHHRERCC